MTAAARIVRHFGGSVCLDRTESHPQFMNRIGRSSTPSTADLSQNGQVSFRRVVAVERSDPTWMCTFSRFDHGTPEAEMWRASLPAE